jgi:predicted CopG family antitoxin
MMPTIRVDEDVYEALRNLGKTGDSFSDVLRPLLQLRHKKPRSRTPSAVAANADFEGVRDIIDTEGNGEAIEEFIEVISRHLPEHWRTSTVRFRQIVFVVAKFLNQPGNLSTAERYLKAYRLVAEQFNVEATTVHDKCVRQLYGTGKPNLIEQFRRALERIEIDWRNRRAR